MRRQGPALKSVASYVPSFVLCWIAGPFSQCLPVIPTIWRDEARGSKIGGQPEQLSDTIKIIKVWM